MWYDDRLELGIGGILVTPVPFIRDGFQHPSNFFTVRTLEERQDLDIYDAVDVTPSYDESTQSKATTGSIVMFDSVAQVTFDIITNKTEAELVAEQRHQGYVQLDFTLKEKLSLEHVDASLARFELEKSIGVAEGATIKTAYSKDCAKKTDKAMKDIDNVILRDEVQPILDAIVWPEV